MKVTRKILGLLILLTGSHFAFSQTSAVTATITDTDGTAWFSGPYTIQLVDSLGKPIAAGGAYRIDTGATITNSFSGTLDGSGALSVTLTSTSNINPAGTKWKFGICPATIPAVCGGTTLAVNASGSLSTQLSASILAPRIGGGQGTQAYVDVEVAATPNNSYYNLTTPGLRCYTTSWAACGGGGGGGTVSSVSVTTANGVSGTVATATTTPAISLTLGAITPTTVNGVTISTLAPLASPALTGTPTVPTAAPGTNTTQAASTAFAVAASTLPTATVAGQLLAATAAGTTYAAQSKIALDPRDYGADFNGAIVADASTTNGSNVVTCPNSDCNFPSTIAGYIIFATAGDGTHCLDNASITFGGNRQTTVATYTNANSITVTGNSNTTGTATVCLAWFPIDSTTALTAWWTAGGCTGSYIMPAGKTLFSSPIMQNIAGCPGSVFSGLSYPGQTVKGAGTGSTYLVPAATFTYTGLSGNQTTNCAVGNTNIEHYDNFAVYGIGERATGAMANTCLFMVGQATDADRIDLVGWDARSGGTTLYGVNMIGVEDVWQVGGTNYFGSVEMHFTNNQQIVLSSYTSGNGSSVNGICGFIVDTTGQVNMIGNGVQVCGQVNAGGVLTSQSSQFLGGPGDAFAFYVNGGQLILLSNDVFFAPLTMFAAPGTLMAYNTTFDGITGLAGTYFYDNGRNTYAGSNSFSTTVWAKNDSVNAVPPTTSNIVYGAGWGATTSPTSTAFKGTDERHFTYTLTMNGTPGTITQATSTITYTFPVAFQVAPGSCSARQVGGTQGAGTSALTFFTTTPPSTTSVVFTSGAIATASLTTIIQVDCF